MDLVQASETGGRAFRFVAVTFKFPAVAKSATGTAIVSVLLLAFMELPEG
jgi:hypothetical protein